MSSEAVQGKLRNFQVFEATVVDVDRRTGDIYITTPDMAELTDPDVIPPIYYGGISGTGIFQHPEIGDTVICTRVYPGGKGITQGIRVIPKTTRVSDSENIVRSESPYLKAGTPEYPIRGMEPGEVRLRGLGGKLDLVGRGERGSGISIGTISGFGLNVRNNSITNSAASLVSNSLKIANDAARISSRSIYRYIDGDPEQINAISSNSYIKIEDIDGGKRRGLFPGKEALPSAILGGFRNPGLSEYRMVINEFAETDYFNGWDNEAAARDDSNLNGFSSAKSLKSLSFEAPLHMGAHQIVEIIIGNVVNSRGEILDPNYGSIVIGSATGLPITDESPAKIYEKARLRSKRGIGYHFQLSTNSLSTGVANNRDNFIVSIDKEGVLKANIPTSSNTGNIFYPAYAEFYNETSGKINTEYSFSRKTEKIPITLRSSGDIYLPSALDIEDYENDQDFQGEEVPERYTGIRFSNENKYFKGFANTSGESDSIRVNPTKHHNMYAAAEMLIANKVRRINIPLTSSECTGLIAGTAIGKSFEILPESETGKFVYPKYMSTVTVFPGEPAIETGGSTVVAGRGLSSEAPKFANSFRLIEGDSGISAVNTDESGNKRRNPGGKSANINLEGSLELSVGKDNFDQKSILLDTAGGMVAWFGKDKNNRSIVMQTDGSVLVNIGGNNGNEFNQGSFDLRVNVANKGFVGEPGDDDDSDYLISISEAGIVIAGMRRATPMVIRNDGNLMIESGSKVILSGTSVVVREGARPERKLNKDPVSADTPGANLEGVAEQVGCIVDSTSE
jgi:hypothetical protein